jgi:hypothetical protein
MVNAEDYIPALKFGATLKSDDLGADIVTGAKVADDAISKEHLDSGIEPTDISVFGNKHTTSGGAAAEAITVTGALSTDKVSVTLVDDGTNNVTIAKAVMTTNTLTVTFSGDPSNDTIIDYEIFRAAA